MDFENREKCAPGKKPYTGDTLVKATKHNKNTMGAPSTLSSAGASSPLSFCGAGRFLFFAFADAALTLPNIVGGRILLLQRRLSDFARGALEAPLVFRIPEVWKRKFYGGM